MINWEPLGRQQRNSAGLRLYSSHFVAVLSLIFSLTLVAIISKNHVINSLWIDVAAFAVPIPIALYFEKRILRFGVFTCVATIVLPLAAALLFGI
jgi:hypothetical protein